MSSNRRADPNCPICHGAGQVIIGSTYLDRIEEVTTDCRCVKESGADGPQDDKTAAKEIS